MEELGRLTKVPLRQFWEGEGGRFHPLVGSREKYKIY